MKISSALYFPWIRSGYNKPLSAEAEKELRLKKWIAYGFEEAFFHKHPGFAEYLAKTLLLGQLKISRDALREVDGEPSLLVEGKLVKFKTFQERFEVKHTTFFERGTGQVYTYLDTGKGFVKHNPSFFERLVPISLLTPEQYQTTLDVARKFVREGERLQSTEERTLHNQERTHIIQIVCPIINDHQKVNFINRRYHRLFVEAKHPSIRIIDDRGQVYGTGFIRQHIPERPLMTIHGWFRSPDVWEYHNPTERLVTNIAASPEEASKLIGYIEGLQKKVHSGNDLAFNAVFQNCTRFVHLAVKAAINVTIEDTISIGAVIAEIMPSFIYAPVGALCKPFCFASRPISGIMPGVVRSSLGYIADKVNGIFQRFCALCLAGLLFSLGGHLGKQGVRFDEHDSSSTMSAPLSDKRTWKDLSVYHFHVPGILVEWQKRQPSTVAYHKPVKLCIAPPSGASGG